MVSQAASKKGLKIRDLRDGISKTIIIAESKHEIYSSWYSGASSAVTALRPEFTDRNVTANAGILNDGFLDAPRGSTGLQYGRSQDEQRAVSVVPWYTTQFPGGEPWDFAQSSEHAGDVVVHCFADDHVKAISSGVDAGTYSRAVARGDGAPIETKKL